MVLEALLVLTDRDFLLVLGVPYCPEVPEDQGRHFLVDRVDQLVLLVREVPCYPETHLVLMVLVVLADQLVLLDPALLVVLQPLAILLVLYFQEFHYFLVDLEGHYCRGAQVGQLSQVYPVLGYQPVLGGL